MFTWDGSTLLLEERFEQPVMAREERIAEMMRHPAPLKVFCEYPPDSDPLPVAQRQHQLDTTQWRGMSMYLYEPDTFVPLARLEQTLEESAHITLGPDGEFIEHPARSSHATYFYQNDHLGTPQELVDEEGEIVWLGKYRAWGELRSASQKNGQPAKIRNALRFQGQYCDDETGLHYNLNRYYDPQAGRFINKDPIGLTGGFNLFQYAPNPATWVDPLGLAGYNVSANTAGPDTLARGAHVNVSGPGLPPSGGHITLTPNAAGTHVDLNPADKATRDMSGSQWGKACNCVIKYMDSVKNVDRLAKAAQAGADAYPNSSRAAELKKVGEILDAHKAAGTNPVSK